MKTSTIVGVLVVLLAIVGGWYALRLPPLDTFRLGGQAPQGVVCTTDAMMCPDGSYVGRSGPNCEFVCPAANTGAGATVQTTVQVATTTWQTGTSAQDDPGLGDGSMPQ